MTNATQENEISLEELFSEDSQSEEIINQVEQTEEQKLGIDVPDEKTVTTPDDLFETETSSGVFEEPDNVEQIFEERKKKFRKVESPDIFSDINGLSSDILYREYNKIGKAIVENDKSPWDVILYKMQKNKETPPREIKGTDREDRWEERRLSRIIVCRWFIGII